MQKEREQLYQTLFKEAANTPIVQYEGNVPNGNRILIKRECDNPYGSHYDRVFPHLFYNAEHQGLIKPDQKVLETTSGSAGASFAAYGARLGYECLVAIPKGGEKAREEAILEHLVSKDHLIYTSADSYISGFPDFVRSFLAKNENKDVYFLNHSMGARGTNNEVTLKSLEVIADEVAHEDIDYFIPAVGNGSNILGIGRKLKILKPSLNIVAFESFQSATAHSRLKPGVYQEVFGIAPGSLPRHQLPGTSFKGIHFPHIENAISSGLLMDVALVSDQKTDNHYKNLNAKGDLSYLPHWDCEMGQTDNLGRTTRAGLAVALNLAEKIQEQTILIIGYDRSNRYDF